MESSLTVNTRNEAPIWAAASAICEEVRRVGSLGQHLRGERSQAGFVDRVGIAAIEHEQVRHHDGQLMLLDQDHGQPVGQLETLGDGQAEFPKRLGCRRLRAPRFVRHGAGDGFTFGLRIRPFLGAGRIVDDAIAGHSVHDRAGRWFELVGGHPLDVFDGCAVVALQILGQIAGIVQIVVVLVQAVGDASEAAQPLEAADHAASRSCCARGRLRPGVGPSERSLSSSSSIAFSRSSGFTPGFAVACSSKTDPSSRVCFWTETSCAICFS